MITDCFIYTTGPPSSLYPRWLESSGSDYTRQLALLILFVSSSVSILLWLFSRLDPRVLIGRFWAWRVSSFWDVEFLQIRITLSNCCHRWWLPRGDNCAWRTKQVFLPILLQNSLVDYVLIREELVNYYSITLIN